MFSETNQMSQVVHTTLKWPNENKIESQLTQVTWNLSFIALVNNLPLPGRGAQP